MDFKTISQNMGNKYYRYIEDDLELIRIIGVSGSDSVNVEFLRSSNKEKINTVEPMRMIDILSNYRCLLSDGFLSFNAVEIVSANGENSCIDDVIVAFWKRENGKVSQLPNVICRQNINDFFYGYMQKNENDTYVGVSVSQEDCPAEIEFVKLLACSKQNVSISFNVYLDDDFENILRYIKTAKFDHILEANLMDHLKCLSKHLGGKVKLKPGTKSINGFCIDLKTLLTENEFWFDIYKELHITPITEELIIEDDKLVDPNQVQLLRVLFKQNINNTFVLKFDKDIDMKKIKSKYVLIKDNTNTLYIVGFTIDGDYVEPDKTTAQVEEETVEALRKIAFRYSKKYNQ